MQPTAQEIRFTVSLVLLALGFVFGAAVMEYWRSQEKSEPEVRYIFVKPRVHVPVQQREWFRSFWQLTYQVPEHKSAITDCANLVNNDLLTLACNVYWEARGEDFDGQLAVATVTRNRVMSGMFPSSYSKVVWQRRGRIPQFEWTFDGRSDIVREPNSWTRALAVAALVMYTDFEPNTQAEFYHRVGLENSSTRWFQRRLVFEQEIGNHAFYMASI